MHAAWKAFIESESCEKIKRTLKSKIRASEQVFNPGTRFITKVTINRDGLDLPKSLSSNINSSHVHDDDLRSVDDNDIDITHDDDQIGNERHYPENSYGDKLSDGNDISSNAATTSTDSLDSSGNPTNESGKQSVLEERVPEAGDDQDELREHDGVDILRRSQRLINREHGWEVYCSNPSIPITEWQVPKELHNSPECIEAKHDELCKLAMCDACEEVPNTGQECISTRWVMTFKGKGVKARLVARGFQERYPVLSDSAAKTAVRTLLALASSDAWRVVPADIKSAFLQGQAIGRDVYIKPPKEASSVPDVIWKLKKCFYGLNDGTQMFYLSVRKKITELGCHVSTVDPSLFFYIDECGCLAGILVSHVDNFLHAGNSEFNERIMTPLNQHFLAGKQEEGRFRCVGFDVCQCDGGVQNQHGS